MPGVTSPNKTLDGEPAVIATDDADRNAGAGKAGRSSGPWWRRLWRSASAWTRAFVHHRDPLVEASNWVAILIGTHLPFWPLYVRWSAGPQAFPTALWTAALTPLFLVIPLLSRRSGLAARVVTPLAGIANTIFTVWVLGPGSGTALFFGPCAALAAFTFRRGERWLMLVLTALPLIAYFGLQHSPPVPLHHYDAEATKSLFVLNVTSVSVIVAAFGWLMGDVYRRMERGGAGVGS